MSDFDKFNSLVKRLTSANQTLNHGADASSIDGIPDGSVDFIDDDPFQTFIEWDSDADRRDYATLADKK